MPRDATSTRARLLDEAERLFATQGVHRTTTREITEAAAQRNVSAATYHFGSRSGLLEAILRRRGDPLDEHRGALIDEPLAAQPTRVLVAALVVPYATCLASASGRHYLRIVAQLTDRFALWGAEGDLSPPHLRHILAELERRMTDRDVAQERVVASIMLLTTSMAERARAIEDDAPVAITERRFVSNLADMIVGIMEASVGRPLGVGHTPLPKAPRMRSSDRLALTRSGVAADAGLTKLLGTPR